MPTSYTTLLGLALPVQGELQGTWGDEVNNYITNYLDASVAGTQTLSTDADVTLTKTTGTALGATSSQYLILNCTGSRAAARNITVPAQSKAYVVINGTTGGFAVTLRGAGPTTGVSIAAGERAVCVWNGSDFVKAASSNGSPGGSTTQVQYNSSGALAGSANLTFDGTSLTLGGNPTLSAGTANGVLYLNGSKVATSGGALTFDGTDLATTGGVRLNNAQYYYGKNAAGSAVRLLGVNAGNVNYVGSIDSGPTEVNYGAATTITAQYWNISGTEQMRLTSTGLGIGTSSPGYKLQVASAGSVAEIVASNSAGSERIHLLSRSSAGVSYVQSQNSQLLVGTYDNYVMQFMTNNTTRMLLDTSGNLGIGTSSPQAKLDVQGNISLINNYRVGYNLATETLTVSGVTTPNYGIAMGSYTGFGGPGLGVSGYYGVLFATNGTERMRLDASGNLGLGVTPTTGWRSGSRALQAGANKYVALWEQANGSANLSFAAYESGTNTFAYTTTGDSPTLYSQLSGAHKWYTAPSGTAGNAITFTQAMTLHASGGLSVGSTSDPGANTIALTKLSMKVDGPFFTGANIDSGNNQLGIGATGANIVGFFTNNTERARITSGGFFKASNDGAYVGSTGSYHELRNTGAGGDWTAIVSNATATSANAFGVRVAYTGSAPNGTGNAFLRCDDTGGERASIRSNGGIANYQANDVNLSDRREKTNFAPAKDYLDTICAIPVQTFNYIDQSEDDPGLTLGVVAQDVQAVAPELVHESNWGTEDEPKMRLSVYQTDLQYALMKCIQEQQALITDLRARVAQLERQA